MAIKKGNFIELNYTGRIDDSTKAVFDTTEESKAKEVGIYNPKTKYGTIVVPLGEGYLLKGLDKQLEGQDLGKHTFQIEAVDAFGKKDAKKLQLIPMKFFKKDNVRPAAGLQINIDGEIGIVRSVSGGRVIVDFNHPLSSKDLIYDVDVIRVVDNKEEQVNAVFNLLGFKVDKVIVDGDKATITSSVKLPEELTKPLSADITRLTGIKEVSFEVSEKK